MKSNLLKIAMPVVAALLVTSCEHKKSPRIVVTKDSIILNGVDLKKSDANAMNAILEQYDKTLFKLDEFDDGKLKETTGEMSELALDRAFESAHVERPIGNAIHVHSGNPHISAVIMCCGGNPHHQTPPPSPTPPVAAEGQSLQTDQDFEDLKKILEKYR